MTVLVPIIVGFLVFSIAHLAIWRTSPSNRPRVILLAWLMIGGVLVSALAHRLINREGGAGLLATIYSEIFLMALYHYFYCGCSRSVSVTLIIRLLESPQRAIPLNVLEEEYAGSSRFVDRIDLMEKSGFVTRSDGRVMLREKGMRVVTLTRFLGACLGTRHEG